MDHKSRVLNALRLREVDRPPFDLFDECGLLFRGDADDPARRMSLSLEGNLDPVHLMRFGTPEAVRSETHRCLEIGARGDGYILSVADCMAAGTPRAHMEIVSEVAHG